MRSTLETGKFMTNESNVIITKPIDEHNMKKGVTITEMTPEERE